MSLHKKYLEVKTSSLPNSGNGLFVKTNVAKGDIITEYKGRKTTWARVEDDVDNGYIYHIDDDHVIDASKSLNTFGRYANDAAGISKVPGLKNNAIYYEEGKRVFIKATKKIPAGAEVFVAYGRAYWKQTRENIKIDGQQKTSPQKKK